jgi:hypothetical protein
VAENRAELTGAFSFWGAQAAGLSHSAAVPNAFGNASTHELVKSVRGKLPRTTDQRPVLPRTGSLLRAILAGIAERHAAYIVQNGNGGEASREACCTPA